MSRPLAGPDPYFFKEVEDRLVQYVIHLQGIGMRMNEVSFMSNAREIAMRLGVPQDKMHAGRKWFALFKGRHLELRYSVRPGSRGNGHRAATTGAKF
jgi:hypothetical protein